MVEKNDVFAMMNDAEVVYLATINPKGPRIRALVNLRRADLYPGPSKTARAADFTVFLATSAASDKARDIRGNPAVSVYYCVPQRYIGVTLSGHAEILDDPAIKQALWSDDWRIYWPTGADDPDYVVVRLTPDEAKGWWGTEQFTLEVA